MATSTISVYERRVRNSVGKKGYKGRRHLVPQRNNNTRDIGIERETIGQAKNESIYTYLNEYT